MKTYDFLLNETNREKNSFEKLANKIDDFQVINLYDRQPNHFDYNFLVSFPTEKLKRKIDSNSIFPRIKSQTFIVRQQIYEENIQMFYKLRVRARNEMLVKIAEFMIAKFFRTNENHLTPILENNPTLKWEILDKLSFKYESMLSSNTRLNDEYAWEEFTKWFKNYLLNHTMEEMVQKYGYERLLSLDDEELNQLFFTKMNDNFSSNDSFIDNFTVVVNSYIKKWISELQVMFELEKDSMKQITDLLSVSGQIGDPQDFDTMVKSNNLIVMNNAIYQFITEVISNKKFIQCTDSKWPKASIDNNILNGYVQLVPYKESEHLYALENEMQEQADNLSELDVDVLDSLCHIYLSKSSSAADSVEVWLDDLLHIRGLKTKLGGSGRRGGYEKEQRLQVLRALSNIQCLWIEMENVLVYEQGKPIRKSVQGRAFHFLDIDGSPCHFTVDQAQDKFLLNIGAMFVHFLKGSGRQVKLLPNQAVEYNPYQKKLEKKLIRYLSWRWRIQARKASYLQPHKIGTLLEKLGVQMESQAPSRIRDRFEKALDLLVDGGVITFWQYNNWNESNMSKKGWLRIWQETTVIIAPPDDIVKYYQPIERKKSIKSQNDFSLLVEEEVNMDIGSEFKEKRINLGFTLQRASDELRISTSYLSNIERGGAMPSYSIYKRMRDWLG